MELDEIIVNAQMAMADLFRECRKLREANQKLATRVIDLEDENNNLRCEISEMSARFQ